MKITFEGTEDEVMRLLAGIGGGQVESADVSPSTAEPIAARRLAAWASEYAGAPVALADVLRHTGLAEDYAATAALTLRKQGWIRHSREQGQPSLWSPPFKAGSASAYDPSGLNPYTEGLLRPEHDILQAPRMSGDWNKPSAAAVPEPVSPITAGPLPSISDDLRAEAWRRFVKFCEVWLYGWEQPDVTQPDRMQAMAEIGSGRVAYPILVMAYEQGSLQRLISQACSELCERDVESGPAYKALREALPGSAAAWNDFIARVTGSMVASSHLAFPDLAGTCDYSTKWRTE